MCWHTVTLCLNPKLFFFFFLFGSEGERWIYGAAAACPGYCELAAFWSCQSVLRPPCLRRDSVRVHTCEESRATDGLARLASPRHRAELQYIHRPTTTGGDFFLRPSSSSLHVSVCSLSACPLLRLSPVTGQTDKATAPLLTVSLGVLCFLFMNGDFVSGTAPPRRQKTRAFYKVLLISTTATGRRLWKKQEFKKRGFLII